MRAFNEISHYEFENDRNASIVKEIQSKGKDYILQIDEQEYIDYLYEKYLLEPLSILRETEFFKAPKIVKENITNHFYGRENHEVDVYIFTIKYSYTGTDELFGVHSNPWAMVSYDIDIDKRSKTVSFSFKIYNQEAEEFKRTKSECYGRAFANVSNVNENVAAFNRSLKDNITRAFQQEKEKYLKENDFFSAINLKVSPDTTSMYSVPTPAKKTIPQPQPQKGKEFGSEPMMATQIYRDVLTLLYESGKGMERKPALYIGKDEEGLRDQFLFVLETRYEAVTASGETFNRSGKTDIILKYAKDGSNIFVSECKFWHGSAEFHAAISQLFERYLTWRDSKVALMLFVRNKDFSNVLATIKEEAKKHKLFVKEAGNSGESSFSYIYCLPQDQGKSVHFEIMAFHYDRK